MGNFKPHPRKKQTADDDVRTLALRRINRYFDLFDRVSVSFSGGKDSTVCLNLALQVARERKRLPLDVFFFDEEAIPPDTIDYVRRVSRVPGIALRWFCIPVKGRNACSRKHPYWYPWDPLCPEKWCFPMPPEAITSVPGFRDEGIPEMNHLIFDRREGSVGLILGLRAQESLARQRGVTAKFSDNDIAWEDNGYIATCKPIYDWQHSDVWLAPQLYHWDYNRAYDAMEATGIPIQAQRVAPPYGEEPMQKLWSFATCWPELWDKMSRRVPGAATAYRYASTELYGFGRVTLPPGQTWERMTYIFLERHPHRYRKIVQDNLDHLIRAHRWAAGETPIPDDIPDPKSGLSWRLISSVVSRGDYKRRRVNVFTTKRQVDPATLDLESALGTRY